MLAALAVCPLVAMMVHLRLLRVPFWNPVFALGAAFGAQMVFGARFADRIVFGLPSSFELPFIGAGLLTVFLMYSFTMLSLPSHRRMRAAGGVLRQYALSRQQARMLEAFLWLNVVASSTVNALIVSKWGTLPIIAYNRYRRTGLPSVGGPLLPQDVAREFVVPFFSVVVDHLVNPAVVAYALLVFARKTWRSGGLPLQGWRSVSWRVHGGMLLMMINAGVVHRRSPLIFAVLTFAVLISANRVIRKTSVAVVLISLFIASAFAGGWRRGSTEFRAAQALGLPAIAGNTVIYEPAVYLGSGVVVFYDFWRRHEDPGGGGMIVSSLLPRYLDEAFGFTFNRTEMLRSVFAQGFMIQGQTLRTGWFEPYFQLGWLGVYVTAVLLACGAMWLYLRALWGPHASVGYFVMLKVILMFPFINLLLQLPFWVTVASVVLIDRIMLSRRKAIQVPPGRAM